MSTTTTTTITTTGVAECGCPVRPAPEIRGDAADTLIEHLPDCDADERDEPTTTTTEPATRRAADLQPGDVIHLPGDRSYELAEVAHVEPMAGLSDVMVVFRGGGYHNSRCGYLYPLADDATAEAWRAEQAETRRRRIQARRLRSLADQIEDGRLPLSDVALMINWSVADRAQLDQVAAVLDGAKLRETSTRGAALTVEDSNEVYIDVFWHRPPLEPEPSGRDEPEGCPGHEADGGA